MYNRCKNFFTIIIHAKNVTDGVILVNLNPTILVGVIHNIYSSHLIFLYI